MTQCFDLFKTTRVNCEQILLSISGEWDAFTDIVYSSSQVADNINVLRGFPWNATKLNELGYKIFPVNTYFS